MLGLGVGPPQSGAAAPQSGRFTQDSDGPCALRAIEPAGRPGGGSGGRASGRQVSS